MKMFWTCSLPTQGLRSLRSVLRQVLCSELPLSRKAVQLFERIDDAIDLAVHNAAPPKRCESVLPALSWIGRDRPHRLHQQSELVS
jgi:hypothetical protein